MAACEVRAPVLAISRKSLFKEKSEQKKCPWPLSKKFLKKNSARSTKRHGKTKDKFSCLSGQSGE